VSLFSGEKLARVSLARDESTTPSVNLATPSQLFTREPAAKSHFEGDPTKSILDLAEPSVHSAEPSVDRSAYLASTSKAGSRVVGPRSVVFVPAAKACAKQA